MSAAAVKLPTSNRGVTQFSEDARYNVLIDWFAASIDLPALLTEAGTILPNKVLLDALAEPGPTPLLVAENILNFLFDAPSFQLDDKVKPGRFYACRVGIKDRAGDHVGLIEFGGPHTVRNDGVYTARVELTGDGCRMYENTAAGCGHAQRWLQLRAKLESCDARITRCDVAVDDLQGENPLAWCLDQYHKGAFDVRGPRPRLQRITHSDPAVGDTYYIGTRASERRLRVYEKGKELGDGESPHVRYEAEFKGSTRKFIPLDVLRDPAAYLLGAYPALAFINAIATLMEVTQAIAASTVEGARKNLRRTYGRVIGFLCRHAQSEEHLAYIMNALASNKPPTWEKKQAANNWPEILAHLRIQHEHTF
jgi:phage replication initiation protein